MEHANIKEKILAYINSLFKAGALLSQMNPEMANFGIILNAADILSADSGFNNRVERNLKIIFDRIECLENSRVIYFNEEEFQTFFLEIYNSLNRTHIIEKKQFYLNCLTNFFYSKELFDVKEIYLSTLSSLTKSHILVLVNIFRIRDIILNDYNTDKLYKELYSNIKDIEFKNFEFLIYDLQQKGLIKVSPILKSSNLIVPVPNVLGIGTISNETYPLIAFTSFCEGFINYIKEIN